MGLEHGGIDIEEIGELETKDATRWRIKWYAGLASLQRAGRGPAARYHRGITRVVGVGREALPPSPYHFRITTRAKR